MSADPKDVQIFVDAVHEAIKDACEAGVSLELQLGILDVSKANLTYGWFERQREKQRRDNSEEPTP